MYILKKLTLYYFTACSSFENLAKELQQMFVSAEVDTTKHQSANETESFRSKNLIKQGRKKKMHSETSKPTNRKIVVYPIDKFIDKTILPVELKILLDDFAAYFISMYQIYLN